MLQLCGEWVSCSLCREWMDGMMGLLAACMRVWPAFGLSSVYSLTAGREGGARTGNAGFAEEG